MTNKSLVWLSYAVTTAKWVEGSLGLSQVN